MRYQDDINTEHNMKSICRAAVAHWTKRLTRNGQTRVQIREEHIFDITYPSSIVNKFPPFFGQPLGSLTNIRQNNFSTK